MRQAGRPRRSEEQPDSEFGELLKEYIHRVKQYTQADLAVESGVAAETISKMVKGRRKGVTALRNDLRAIITALRRRKALLTLDEANRLLLAYPAVSVLDDRDADDKKVIDLFAPPATDSPITTSQSEHQSDDHIVRPDIPDVVNHQDADDTPVVPPIEQKDTQVEPVAMDPIMEFPPAPFLANDAGTSSEAGSEIVMTPMRIEPLLEIPSSDDMLLPHGSAGSVASSPTVASSPQEPSITPVPATPPVGRLQNVTRGFMRGQRWRYGSVALALIVAVGLLLAVAHNMASGQGSTCTDTSGGVTLYTNINDQGQCHTFGVGDFALARYGLDQKVSSVRDPNDGFHIVLYDKAKNFYYVDKDTPALPAAWDKRADEIHIEKHRPTSCHPGSNGIIAFIDPDYSGGCLFITHDIPDLTPLNFDSVLISLQFVGSYRHTSQLVIYRKPNYQAECGTYWQDQSDLEQCARLALSVRVLPFTAPTPIPTLVGTRYAGNVASQATVSPSSAGAVIDGSLQTEWVGGHMVELDLRWPYPVTVYRVVVWDRRQSPTDNNQINKLKLVFGNGAATGSLDMISGGPRCIDVTLPQQTITWLHIIPVDASGNNGYREVEVWATTGPQYSDNTCVNKRVIVQTVSQ